MKTNQLTFLSRPAASVDGAPQRRPPARVNRVLLGTDTDNNPELEFHILEQGFEDAEDEHQFEAVEAARPARQLPNPTARGISRQGPNDGVAPDSPVVWANETSAITVCEREKQGFEPRQP